MHYRNKVLVEWRSYKIWVYENGARMRHAPISIRVGIPI